ncbi:MAG: D-alanyl-D-alanine carboxypeptidase/D-alanyl-D-alanine-endopeptidase [Chitinispirillaceae bacterium]
MSVRKRVFALFIPLVLIRLVFGSMQGKVEKLLHARSYTGGGIAVVIKDLDTDSNVVSINADSMMIPASVSKLVTGAAAFETLGSDYTFETPVYIDGTYNCDSGVVHGNLYIQGRGDPGFSAEKMWLFVQHLKHRGINVIDGDLVLDDFFFDSVRVGPGFSNNDGSRAYQSIIGALSANFSSIAIHHRSGQHVGSPVHVDVFPRIEGLKINSSAVTVPSGTRGSLDIRTSQSAGVTQIDVRGAMALNEPSRYTFRKVWQTWEVFGGAVRSLFRENGIQITGKTVRKRVPSGLESQDPFYTFKGQPLSDYVGHMFRHSNNFVSEMLFKTMGAVRDGSPGTWLNGAAVVSRWWAELDLPGKPLISNGSGMGKTTNRLSASQIVELLSYVSRQKRYFPDYLASLSVSGVDGTLEDRFQRSRLKGIVRAKTGTLNSIRVSTLAGYVLLEDETYAFAILCNGVGRGQYDNWVMQEQILEKLIAGIRWVD